MRISYKTVLVVTALSLFAHAAWAQSTVIAVANSGFEAPILADNSFTNNNVPSWTWAGGGSTPSDYTFGVFNPNSSGAFVSPVPDGKQTAYINSGMLYQDTITLMAGTTYTLSGYIGQRKDVSGSGSLNLYTSDGTFLAGTGSEAPPVGTFGLYSLNYVANSAVAGKTLRILLNDNSVGQANFDQISLTATVVPEPSGWEPLAVSVLALVFLILRGRQTPLVI